jgi:hypothetical protein
MRGWVCNLLVQLLLGLARASNLGSKSRRTHDHILLSHLRLPQLGGPIISFQVQVIFATDSRPVCLGVGPQIFLLVGYLRSSCHSLIEVPQNS